ncbi:MAG: RnfABCDGE type electron transport complex subunit D [Deltaproteobacteria bacterium]|nr:RnfABCDGE type electron transport complex subunit D [Deltaproteobacteria bacterium]
MTLKDLHAPPLRDARYLQTLILIIYAFVARAFFNFERPHFAALICVAWAVALDLFIGKFYFKKVLFPLSAVIIGLSASILIDPDHWSYFLIVVTAAVLSKALITYRGKHFFNPTNFGVVLAIQLLPNHVAAIPHLFSGYLWPSVVFAVLGLLTVVLARQTAVSFSWTAGFIAVALYRASRAGSNVWVAFGPLLSSSFLLFTFHMISDPGTTPRTWRMQIAFGLMAAFIDGLLRVYQVPHGQFYALFVVSATLCWFRAYEERAVPAIGTKT